MTPFAAELVSDKPCFYHDIFFAIGTRVLQKNGKSLTLSVLSVLIHRYMLRLSATGEVGMSWLAHRALTHLCQQHCLQATASVDLSSSWDGPVHSATTFPATLSSQFKLDLKESATTNEVKQEPAQTTAAELLRNESHATANVSLLACLQKLSTATLNEPAV